MAGGVVIKTDNRTVLAGLDEARVAIGDVPLMLRVAGELMRASVARTFRQEGSPAGSWPRLAASTLRNKKYTTGHKLLVLSGRLFGSITYVVSGNTLTIGTNLVYAAVHQFGSAGGGAPAAGAGWAAMRAAARAHKRGRRQNIPARPFLVFRPEDPQRIFEGFEAYLAGKLVRVGRVTSVRGAGGLVTG